MEKNKKEICVCVCVWERERERGDGIEKLAFMQRSERGEGKSYVNWKRSVLKQRESKCNGLRVSETASRPVQIVQNKQGQNGRI